RHKGTRRESGEKAGLGLVPRDEECRVDGPRLAEAVNAADALFQSRGMPWQLDAHDPPRAILQIQPLSRDIGGEQHRGVPTLELMEVDRSLGRGLSSVQGGD